LEGGTLLPDTATCNATSHQISDLLLSLAQIFMTEELLCVCVPVVVVVCVCVPVVVVVVVVVVVFKAFFIQFVCFFSITKCDNTLTMINQLLIICLPL
jgi:hypothetical protein